MSFNRSTERIQEGETVPLVPMTEERITAISRDRPYGDGSMMTPVDYPASHGHPFLDRTDPLVAATENNPDEPFQPQGFFRAIFALFFGRNRS